MKTTSHQSPSHRLSVDADPGPDSAPSRQRVNSRLLFGRQNEILIEHQGDEYRLRITSNGKLILTK